MYDTPRRFARALVSALLPMMWLQAASAQEASDGFARSRGLQRCYGVFDARSKAEPDNLPLKLLASNFQLVAMLSYIADAHTPAGQAALAASAAAEAASGAATEATSAPRKSSSEQTAEEARREARPFLDELAALPDEAARKQRLAAFTADCQRTGQLFIAQAQKH